MPGKHIWQLAVVTPSGSNIMLTTDDEKEAQLRFLNADYHCVNVRVFKDGAPMTISEALSWASSAHRKTGEKFGKVRPLQYSVRKEYT